MQVRSRHRVNRSEDLILSLVHAKYQRTELAAGGREAEGGPSVRAEAGAASQALPVSPQRRGGCHLAPPGSPPS